MNPAETTAILSLIAGLDYRAAPRDDREAQMRIASWTDLLADVAFEDARAFVKRFYRSENPWPIKVGDIYQGCKPNPKWEDKDEHQALAGRPIPEDVRSLLPKDPHRAARQKPCPWCKASAGSPCTVLGEPMRDGKVHPSRQELAA